MNVKTIFTRTAMILFLALFCFSGIWAEDVTTEQALEQALEFLANQTTTSGRPRRAQGITPQLTLGGKVNGLYVFNVDDNNGFVIVSNDDRTVPILGFSESGSFNPDDMPCNMRAWLQGYADEIAWLAEHGQTTSSLKKARQKAGSHSTAAIAPLTSTTWNQGTPYNNLCPKYKGTSKAATGCVATAMAQVMKYHEWPTSSKRTIPAYTTGSYGISMSALPITTFDWANMKDSYSGSYTSDQATAVATLMQYCGCSVQMDYGPESGSNTDMVASALKTYFGYKSTTKYVVRSYYTYANWTDLIYHEIAHARPVVYGGASSGGGHEFVCDGYKYENGTDFFHINWGWGGMSDDYFVLSALDPDQQGIGGSTSSDGFHYGQDAVIGIQKSTDTGTIANIPSNNVNLTMNSMTLNSTTAFVNTSVSVTLNITNNSTDDYDGDLWIGIKDDEDYYGILEGNSFLIPAGQTKDCDISFTPTWTGTFNLVLFLPSDERGYYTDGEVAATLNVIEAQTNEFVPIYGYYCDQLSRSQFIIPAANLQNMLNTYLTGMTFYASQSSISWGKAEFDVYLSEESETTISSLKDWDTLSKVYAGSLSVSNGQMAIAFDTPYRYHGGNLLVGINQTVKGSYVKSSWYGETANGASLGGYNNSTSQKNFLPLVDFDTSVAPAVAIPTDIAITPASTSATITWAGEADSYNVRYRKPGTEAIAFEDDFEDGLGLWTIYTEGESQSGTGWRVSNPANGLEFEAHSGSYGASSFSWNGSAYHVNNWLVTPPVDLGGTLKFWVRTNAGYPDSYEVLLSTSGNATTDFTTTLQAMAPAPSNGQWNEVIIDLGAFAGQKGYIAIHHEDYDMNYLFIDDFGIYNEASAATDWISASTTETSIRLTGLTSQSIYEVQIQAVSGEDTSDWTEPVTFTTLAPVDIALNAKQDNTSIIEANNGTCANVTINGRTFRKDGSWQTICLPFDVELEGSVLEGADIRALESAKMRETFLLLDFTPVTALQAGIPYIIKWDGGSDIANPTFEDVTIQNTSPVFVSALDNKVTFGGSYANSVFSSPFRSYYVDGSQILASCVSGTETDAFDAIFYLSGEFSPTIAEAALNTGDEEELITGISLLPATPKEERVHNLAGQQILNCKLHRGVNIISGKKLLVK